jgi:hypothetical protein
VLFLAQGMSQNDVVFDVLSGIADAGDSSRAPQRPRGVCQPCRGCPSIAVGRVAPHSACTDWLPGAAGFVRTDLLEGLDRLGQINRSALRVLDSVANLSAADGRPFPFESSTALYPEYALGALPRVDWAVVRAVQGALQRINSSSPAARAGLYSTFQARSPLRALARIDAGTPAGRAGPGLCAHSQPPISCTKTRLRPRMFTAYAHAGLPLACACAAETLSTRKLECTHPNRLGRT